MGEHNVAGEEPVRFMDPAHPIRCGESGTAKASPQHGGIGTRAEEGTLIHPHEREHTLMYWMVFSSFGRTTLSKAFTRLLVVLMASSRVRNAVCRDASCTRSSMEFMNALRHV